MARIAALDYGRARIGMAISDPFKIIAQPAACILNDASLFSSLTKELKKWEPIETLVIGLPLQMNGKEGEMALEVRRFAEALKAHTAIPLVFWDERLTSAQAEKQLKEQELSRKQRAKKIDAAAALLILESFLAHSG